MIDGSPVFVFCHLLWPALALMFAFIVCFEFTHDFSICRLSDCHRTWIWQDGIWLILLLVSVTCVTSFNLTSTCCDRKIFRYCPYMPHALIIKCVNNMRFITSFLYLWCSPQTDQHSSEWCIGSSSLRKRPLCKIRCQLQAVDLPPPQSDRGRVWWGFIVCVLFS